MVNYFRLAQQRLSCVFRSNAMYLGRVLLLAVLCSSVHRAGSKRPTSVQVTSRNLTGLRRDACFQKNKVHLLRVSILVVLIL